MHPCESTTAEERLLLAAEIFSSMSVTLIPRRGYGWPAVLLVRRPMTITWCPHVFAIAWIMREMVTRADCLDVEWIFQKVVLKADYSCGIFTVGCTLKCNKDPIHFLGFLIARSEVFEKTVSK